MSTDVAAALRRRTSVAKFLKTGCDDEEGDSYLDRGARAAADNRWLFEVSWEVCNKVGGIYTVIRTKAATTIAEYGDQFCFVGPLNPDQVRMEMDVCEPPNDALRRTISKMRSEGVRVIYGRWLIEGYPGAVLLDINSSWSYFESARRELWERCMIGIRNEDDESRRAALFGFLVCWFLGEFRAQSESHGSAALQPTVIAHFHEWQAGLGLVFARTRRVDIATIFTTHATLLGRYLCAGQLDFYNNLEHFNVDAEAHNRGIFDRYCIERASTASAHVFTTVSTITALEAKHLLKRPADCITPNGINTTNSAMLHEFQNLHAIAKGKINRFVQGHFYGHFDFDLDKTMYVFSAGRLEYTNKGVDLFIESLARLNAQLKSSNSDKTVIAFLIFPAVTNSFNVESLRAQAIAKQLRDTVDEVQKDIGARMFETVVCGRMPRSEDLLKQTDVVKLKRVVYASNRQALPPICTHNVVDDDKDPILANLRRCQLFNSQNDRVKVIYHPEFLTSTNPLLGMDYDEFVRGCHLGVFPSYYEPWGYTPAECTIRGVPNVSTNLSGFGCFIADHVEDPSSYGIYIVDRQSQAVEDSVRQLTNIMFDFTKLSRRQRIILRNRTERLSDLLDWELLGVYYRKARMLAMQATWKDRHYLFVGASARTQIAGQSRRGFLFRRPASIPPTPGTMSRAASPPPEDEALEQVVHQSASASSVVQAPEDPDVDEDEERTELNLPKSEDIAARLRGINISESEPDDDELISINRSRSPAVSGGETDDGASEKA